MVDRNAPTNAGPVVICCAEADANTIRPVVDDLEGQGHLVVLLDSVQQSPERLAPTIERLHGEGLYVLCRSKALGRTAVDELRDILLAHHVPFGRTLTVASTRPRELRERIGASLRRLASGRARRMSNVAPDGSSPRARTKLGLPPPQPHPTGESDFDGEETTDVMPGAVKTRVGMAAPVAPPAPKTSEARADEPPPSKRDTVNPEADAFEGSDTELDPDDLFEDVPEPPARLTPAREPEYAPQHVSTEFTSSDVLIRPGELADLDEEAAEGQEEGEDAVEDEWPVRSGITAVAPLLERSQLAAIRTGDTAIVSREALIAAGMSEEDFLPPPRRAQAEPPPPPASPPDAAEPPGEPPAAPPSPPPTEPTYAELGAEEKPAGLPWMWIGLGGGALVLVIILAIALSGDDEDETADDDTVARADRKDDAEEDDAKDEGDDADDEDPDAQEVADEPAGPGPTRIGHALRSREIRSLDVLLVSNTEGPFTWDAAKEHCSGLELAGLGAWRLPEVGELMSLTAASMTQRGYYWSQTPADTFGDAPLVWYARRSRVVTRDKDNLVLCVRGGPTAG